MWVPVAITNLETCQSKQTLRTPAKKCQPQLARSIGCQETANPWPLGSKKTHWLHSLLKQRLIHTSIIVEFSSGGLPFEADIWTVSPSDIRQFHGVWQSWNCCVDVFFIFFAWMWEVCVFQLVPWGVTLLRPGHWKMWFIDRKSNFWGLPETSSGCP